MPHPLRDKANDTKKQKFMDMIGTTDRFEPLHERAYRLADIEPDPDSDAALRGSHKVVP